MRSALIRTIEPIIIQVSLLTLLIGFCYIYKEDNYDQSAVKDY